MDDIRSKINLVAAIGAAGAVIAFAGTVMSWTEFPKAVGFLEMAVFGILAVLGILNTRPASGLRPAVWNSALGIAAMAVAVSCYVRIADLNPEASAFMDVGLGIWLTFAGTIIFTIFSISDWTYKRKL